MCSAGCQCVDMQLLRHSECFFRLTYGVASVLQVARVLLCGVLAIANILQCSC